MKNRNYLLLFLLLFCMFITKGYAITIRETMDQNDSYSTLEEGSIVIGVTRFSSDNIVTASKAATAGVNDIKLYMLQQGNFDNYESPGVYYYVDPYVGWFFLDEENNVTVVTDPLELERLSNLDIYYVDNVEKVLEVELVSEDIDYSTLPDGVVYRDNKLYINATMQKVELKTKDKKDISFIFDATTSTFIKNVKTCFTVNNGVITSYNKDCGSDVVIPLEINDEKITGIGVDAFRNTDLVSVIIPSQIISLGSNSFAGNKLESVIIKDKYDELDFSFYGDNVFGSFNDIVYDNELTRMLKYVDDDYVLKYYKTFDIETLTRDFSIQYGLIDYISYDLKRKISQNSNDMKFNYCWKTCYFEEEYINGDRVTNKDIYGVSLNYLGDYKYDVFIEKYDVLENKVYKVNKIMNIMFEETGIKEDYNVVQEAIANIQMDIRYPEIQYGHDVYTRYKYIQDLEDLYDINTVITPLYYGEGLSDGDKIVHDLHGTDIYYLKNGVLYDNVFRTAIIGYENHYKPTIMVDDYDTIDDYLVDVINEFVKDTGVSNYYIYPNADGKIYGMGEQKYKTGIYYEVELIDIDYSERWKIEFIDYYDDQYDDDGYTMASCFGFNNGVITSYNGMCGANVKIPNQINGIDVIEIADEDNMTEEHELFAYSGLRSIVLPSKLQRIGDNAFNTNNIVELIIPETVIEIGFSAFSYNKIKNLVLPDSLKELGADAFEDNEIETLKLSTNLTKINPETFAYNKIKNLVIPESIKEIGFNAFKNNEIETLIINEGLERIETESFSNNKIKSLILPSTLKEIENAVFNNNQLSDDEAFIYARKYDEDNGIYFYDYETLVSYGGANRETVLVPNVVRTITTNALRNCEIEEIKLPYGLKKIGNNAFAGNKLTKMSIPDTVTDIDSYVFDENLFSGDNSFIYMHDKDGNIDKTNLIAYVNDSYYDIDEVIIPDGVKKIWSNAFNSGTINNLVIPYGVEEIGDYAFRYVNINNIITLPKSIKKIGKNIFNNSYSKYDEEGLVYARNEDGTIDKAILMGYKGYLSGNGDRILVLPEGIVEIRENVFNDNYNINGILLPSTLEKIGDNAFYNIKVNEIVVPSSVKSIGNNAFNINNGTLKIFIENKSRESEFEYLGNDPFGNASEVIYENKIEVSDISLNKNSTNLSVGEIEELILEINPSDASEVNISWSSSDSSVVTVLDGIITAVGSGSAIITVEVNGLITTCDVIVNEVYSIVYEKIDVSVIDEYYLYIVNSKGEKVSGIVNVTYHNDKSKEYEVSSSGLKLIKGAVLSVDIISGN